MLQLYSAVNAINLSRVQFSSMNIYHEQISHYAADFKY